MDLFWQQVAREYALDLVIFAVSFRLGGIRGWGWRSLVAAAIATGVRFWVIR